MQIDINSRVVFEGKDYIVLNKPGGMLSQAGRTADKGSSLLELIEKERQHRYHLFTRLDRPVSGLSLLSSNKSFQQSYLMAQSNSAVVKTYLALVEGHLNVKDRILRHHALHDTRKQKSIILHSANNKSKLLESTVNSLWLMDNYTVVEIKIHAGRFHQIRSQLSHIGHPIKGDLKYGARRRNKEPYIFLHAYGLQMELDHGQVLSHEAGLPKNVDLWRRVAEKLNLAQHG